MARFVVQLMPGKLVVWSNTVDAPVSPVMDREQLVDHLARHEQVTYDEAVAIVDVAERDGTSDSSQPLDGVLARNRAGPNEEALDARGIVARYS
jgi:hypothetical protein